jgi:hypothetical protein
MKTIYKFLAIVLLAFPLRGLAQCDLPLPFEGNTGSNMTVMLTPTFINSLSATDENAYIIGFNSNGLVVGSKAVYGLSQTSIAIWGNDSATNEIEGAMAGESISFQFVNGINLYDLVMPSPLS